MGRGVMRPVDATGTYQDQCPERRWATSTISPHNGIYGSREGENASVTFSFTFSYAAGTLFGAVAVRVPARVLLRPAALPASGCARCLACAIPAREFGCLMENNLDLQQGLEFVFGGR